MLFHPPKKWSFLSPTAGAWSFPRRETGRWDDWQSQGFASSGWILLKGSTYRLPLRIIGPANARVNEPVITPGGRVGSWKMPPGYWGVTGRYLHSTHFVSFFSDSMRKRYHVFFFSSRPFFCHSQSDWVFRMLRVKTCDFISGRKRGSHSNLSFGEFHFWRLQLEPDRKRVWQERHV